MRAARQGEAAVVQISYMGTKRRLSPRIAEIVHDCQGGPLLDAFAGMCSVGTEVAPRRQIWANDAQVFSNTVANAIFRAEDWPPTAQDLSPDLIQPLHLNVMALSAMHGRKAQAEADALAREDHNVLADIFEEGTSQTSFPGGTEGGPYDLFTQRFAGVYFSTQQCIEIDSVRCAIDKLLAQGTISRDEHRWVLLALAVALNKCTTSTGHFAQPLAPKSANVSRIAKQRSRSIVIEVLKALVGLRPASTIKWRRKNRVFLGEAGELITRLKASEGRPGIVYADPPYTSDQYSRYYHLYETLVLYDYPDCTGRGMYRNDRAVSAFSLPAKVEGAINALIEGAAASGADMLLSYPSEGLLQNSREIIPSMFETHYGSVPQVIEIAHSHSTMGASKGAAAARPVVELVYRGSA
jgi:adenine-specific DNA-methyltransferase